MNGSVSNCPPREFQNDGTDSDTPRRPGRPRKKFPPVAPPVAEAPPPAPPASAPSLSGSPSQSGARSEGSPPPKPVPVDGRCVLPRCTRFTQGGTAYCVVHRPECSVAGCSKAVAGSGNLCIEHDPSIVA